MYNNNITYNKKWETEENRAWLKKLDDKYFDRSQCAPDCPAAWAQEVFELFEMLNISLGIERNTSTLRSYYVRGSIKDWFLIDPIKGAYNIFINQFFKPKPDYQTKAHSILEKLTRVASAFTHPFGYGFRCIKVLHINAILNRIFKPKLRLSQVKEKYGYLTLYIDVDPAHEVWVQAEIKKVEIRLALKGCYYSIESLYESTSSRYVGDKFNPDIVEIEKGINPHNGESYTKVIQTSHRSLMKEMGLNLEPIAVKAMIAATIKEKQ